MKRGSSRRKNRSSLYPMPAALALGLVLLPMAGWPRGEAAGQEMGGASLAQTAHFELANPMPGARISAGWGRMRSPFSGKEAHHRGIDLVGVPGAGVHAAAPGVVEEATAEYAGGKDHGTVVILDHSNGIKTFYSHLDDLAVVRGERVKGGALLGTQGSTGRVTGPHLHFEVWVDGEFRDPALFVPDWKKDGQRAKT